MKKQTIAIIGVLGVLLFTGLTAEPRIINREQEAKDYPALQETEKRLDANIGEAYSRINVFGPLVEKAKLDRNSLNREKQDPLNFNNTFRFLKFTPRNTYVRFVSEDAPVSADKPEQKDAAAFVLSGLGDKQELLSRIDEKVKQANAAGVKVSAPAFQNRDGVELTQFEFVYDEEGPDRAAIGSRRKSLALYFKPSGGAAGESAFALEMVVSRVVEDNMAEGLRDVEVIIDPSPNTPDLDDIVIVHRYNQKPANVALVGTMSNTPNNPLRNMIKQKFYAKLLDHFFRLYRLVDGYASKDSNDYNREVIQKLEKGMEY